MHSALISITYTSCQVRVLAIWYIYDVIVSSLFCIFCNFSLKFDAKKGSSGYSKSESGYLKGPKVFWLSPKIPFVLSMEWRGQVKLAYTPYINPFFLPLRFTIYCAKLWLFDYSVQHHIVRPPPRKSEDYNDSFYTLLTLLVGILAIFINCPWMQGYAIETVVCLLPIFLLIRDQQDQI